MEERQVTIDGVRHSLSPLFTVLATQNPVEFEGTYPLPEAQLDRFLLKIKIGYPSAQEELEILAKHNNPVAALGEQVEIAPIEPEELQQARVQLRQLTVEQSLVGYISEIRQRTPSLPSFSLGGRPRPRTPLSLRPNHPPPTAS